MVPRTKTLHFALSNVSLYFLLFISVYLQVLPYQLCMCVSSGSSAMDVNSAVDQSKYSWWSRCGQYKREDKRSCLFLAYKAFAYLCVWHCTIISVIFSALNTGTFCNFYCHFNCLFLSLSFLGPLQWIKVDFYKIPAVNSVKTSINKNHKSLLR